MAERQSARLRRASSIVPAAQLFIVIFRLEGTQAFTETEMNGPPDGGPLAAKQDTWLAPLPCFAAGVEPRRLFLRRSVARLARQKCRSPQGGTLRVSPRGPTNPLSHFYTSTMYGVKLTFSPSSKC